MLDKQILLKGERTIIRPFAEDDITDRYVSWLNNKELMKFSNQRFIKHDKITSLDYLNSFFGTSNGFFAVECSCTNKLIGTMTVYFDQRLAVADVGILIGEKEVAGKGYGAECWCVMLEWLKTRKEVRKITAGTVSVNKPMLSLMHAASMQEDGFRRQQELIDGKPVDILYFALYR